MEEHLAVPQKTRRSLFRKWMRLCLLSVPLTLIMFLVTYPVHKVPVHKVSNVLAWAFMGSMFLVVFSGFLWIMWGFVKVMLQSMDIAFNEIPTPSEIGWQLSQDWGRPATVEEVAAVHSMLTSEHNQALLSTGIGFAGLYAMNRIIEGKPIL